MNDKEMNDILLQQKYDFDADFNSDIINKITSKNFTKNDFVWFVYGIAASLFLCLMLVYWQDGQISYDTLLGIDSLNNDTLNEYNFYQ
ncbi:MAG: hypothetical protein ACPGYY_02995 [Bacteroidia bacterium]